MTKILEVKNMNIAFDRYNGMSLIHENVIENLSFDLMENEILAIVGSSGSGKSLFSKALMGILPQNATISCEIYYKGKNVSNIQENAAYIPQSVTFLDPTLKINKQVTLTSDKLSKQCIGKYPFQCSGGMIRSALFDLIYEEDTKIIIADEPTPGMDYQTAMNTAKKFLDLKNRGKSIIFITHDIELAAVICDKMAVFYDGTIVDIIESSSFLSGDITHKYTKALFDNLPQYSNFKMEKRLSDMSDTLSCTDLSFSYDDKKSIFEKINLTFRRDEITCITAQSGFGKSTFSQVLAGYLKPVTGKVLLNNQPLNDNGTNGVQLIFQHPEKSVNPKWKIRDILCEGGTFDENSLIKIGLPFEYLNKFPYELSGGELQRVCILRALKKETQFLICDEITTMLDTITSKEIWHFLLSEVSAKNIGLIIITHNLHIGKKLCDKIIDFEKVCIDKTTNNINFLQQNHNIH